MERDLIKAEFYGKYSAYQAVKSDYALNPTEDKARQMAFYQLAMDEAAYMVVIHELYDTLDFNRDTLLTWIGNMGCLEGDLWLAVERLGMGNTPAAIALLNAATAKYQLTGFGQTDIDNYKSIVNILDGRPFYTLDGASLQSINSYLDVDGYAEGWAKSIATLYGRHFPAEYVKDGQGEERYSKGENASGQLQQTVTVTTRPNPAKDYVEFSISLSKDSADVSIRIIDVNGRLVITQNGLSPIGSFTWHTDGNPSGIYFYHLVADGQVRHSGKVFLNK